MKKWKIILAAFSLLLIAGAGYVYYLLEVKTYEVKDEQVEEVVSEDYDIALPGDESSDEATPAEETDDETVEENDPEETSDESDDQNSESSNTKTTESSSTSSNNKESETKADKSSLTVSSDKKVAKTASPEKTDTKQKPKAPAKPAAKDIAAKYEPSFVQLEAQANSKIDALVSHAYGEYKSKKQNGEDVDYFYFYSKYSTAGKILERKTDSTFNYVYGALVKELGDNGYDATEAKKYKTAYEAAKKERRSAILDKAKSNM